MAILFKVIDKTKTIYNSDLSIDDLNKGRFYVHIEEISKVATLSFTGMKFNTAFYTEMGGHTHTAADHAHTTGNHQHTFSHSHSTSDHQHSCNHSHGMYNHTHGGGSHSHSVAAHSHTISSHNHTVIAHTHPYGVDYHTAGGWGSGMGDVGLGWVSTPTVNTSADNAQTDVQSPTTANSTDSSSQSTSQATTSDGGNTGNWSGTSASGGDVATSASGTAVTTSTGNVSVSATSNNKQYFPTNQLRLSVDGAPIGTYGNGSTFDEGPIDLLSNLNSLGEHYIEFECLSANTGGRINYTLILD